MNQVYTFHKTVRGHLHIMNDIVCEDASISFSSANGKYHIAIVADGHGSKACFRSEFGSKIATEVALECLQQFAETMLVSDESEKRFYVDVFSNPRFRKITLRHLTDTIIAEWYNRVCDNYKNNPPTIEEIEECDTECKNVTDIAHIYGTTLIAALQLSECLILLHQGDGRCEVFFHNGTIEQPIPWDLRCEDTTTTSLCDVDVADSFRTCVINLKEKPVMACYLGSDGVEDAYRDTYEELGGSHILMGGVHTFYKDLTCQIASMEQEQFEKYTESMLSEFSANGRFGGSGSGDDVSVAGIVNIDAIQSYVKQFQCDIRRYALEEKLFWKEDELRGKSRKHDILKNRMNDAKEELKKEQEVKRVLEVKLQQLKMKRHSQARVVEQEKKELEKCRQEQQVITNKLGTDLLENLHISKSYISSAFLQFYNDLHAGYSCEEIKYNKSLEKLLLYDENIRKLEEDQLNEAEKIQDLENKFRESQEIFKIYDEKYQEIDCERRSIVEEIAALPEEK